MTDWTPGPWYVDLSQDPVRVLADDGRATIISPGNAPRANCSAMADARLMAAAPDLYAALARLMADLPSNKDWLDPTLEAEAKAALAKARGESE